MKTLIKVSFLGIMLACSLAKAVMSSASIEGKKTTLRELSSHRDFAVVFDQAEYDSSRSGALRDTKNGLILSVRCFSSPSEVTYAIRLVDYNLEDTVTLDIGKSRCETLLNEVIRDGRISKRNPLLTVWNNYSRSNLDSIRLSVIQLGEATLSIKSTNYDQQPNDERESAAMRSEFRLGQRQLYVAPSDAIVVNSNSPIYVKQYDGNLKIRTEGLKITNCQKKGADTIERFFRHLLGDECYRF